MSTDYYRTLGVKPDARQEEIVEAFFELTRRYHPLINRRPASAQKMQTIAEAWQVLSDRARREEYDRQQLDEERDLINRYFLRVRFEIKAAIGAFFRHLRRNWKGIALGILLLLLGYGAFLRNSELVQTVRATGVERRIANLAALFAPVASPAVAASTANVPAPAEPGQQAASAAIAGLALAAEYSWETATPTAGPESTNLVTSRPDTPEADIMPTSTTAPSDDGVEAAWVVPTLAPVGIVSASPSPTLTAVPTLSKPAVAVSSNASRPPAAAPTRVAAASAAPAGNKYPAPSPLSMQLTKYSCKLPLTLGWTVAPPVTLRSDEWFIVESRRENQGIFTGIVEWTKNLSTTLYPAKGPSGCSALWWPGPGRYEWHVRIIRGDIASHAIRQFLSDPSAAPVIDYAP